MRNHQEWGHKPPTLREQVDLLVESLALGPYTTTFLNASGEPTHPLSRLAIMTGTSHRRIDELDFNGSPVDELIDSTHLQYFDENVLWEVVEAWEYHADGTREGGEKAVSGVAEYLRKVCYAEGWDSDEVVGDDI